MRKPIYNDVQRTELMKNIYVKNCTSKSISYTPDAKIKALEMWRSWESVRQVFENLWFPWYILNTTIPKKCIYRWNKITQKHGTKAIKKEGRWTWWARYKKRDISKMSSKEYIQYLETELAYVKEENTLFKQVKKNVPPKSERFKIIHKLSQKGHYIKTLCYVAEVSLSWYYCFKRRLNAKELIEHREKSDKELIQNLVLKWKRRRGYRTITMLVNVSWIKMNHKKVYRIMKKYGYLAITRRRNPYKWMMKATMEHRRMKNILNRDFKTWKPYEKLGTDITYMKYNWKNLYLSIVKDIISGEAISHYLSANLSIDIISETLKKLHKYQENKNVSFEGSIIHSDQWVHYTHPDFSSWVKKLWFIQSMSRRWNCLDNAPTESFFWHMKDEIDISECKDINDVKLYIDNYIYDYNNMRPQWNKKKMTPVEYRNYLLLEWTN